jgi:hypothetical protein
LLLREYPGREPLEIAAAIEPLAIHAHGLAGMEGE